MAGRFKRNGRAGSLARSDPQRERPLFYNECLAQDRVTLGALLSLGVISGALVSHLTKLGIVVKDDGGLLFALAVTVFVCSLAVLILRRQQIPLVSRFFLPSPTNGLAATTCQH